MPCKSIRRDLRTVGAQGAILRITNFCFSEGPNVGEGPLLIKEGSTLVLR